jgi:hypothetical protein
MNLLLYFFEMDLPRSNRQENLSLAYISAVVAQAGYDCGRPGSIDVGEDLEIYTIIKNKNGKLLKSGPNLYIQAKSSQNYEISEDGMYIKYDLDIDNYHKLVTIEDRVYPIILILYCMPAEEDQWLNICEANTTLRHCGYWICLMGEPESTNKESIRVYIPRDQVFDARALKIIMDKIRKEEFLNG